MTITFPAAEENWQTTNVIVVSLHNLDFRSQAPGADPEFDQGGVPDRDRPKLLTCAAVSCERSKPFSAQGPGSALGPQKLLGISLLNMHSLHLGVPFYTIFEIIKY